MTTLTRHPGGASVQVHARIDESFTLVYDAIVTRSGAVSAPPAAVATGTAVAQPLSTQSDAGAEPDDAEILADNLTQGANLGAGFAKWSPDSGETVHDRLATIVGGAMGYEAEDLPWEVPLIELGLDSLMAVRIKNRVEYDFDLPPIQLTAVRDANLYAVQSLIEYAIEHRDEVQELHAHQQTLTPEIAAEQAALMAGQAPAAPEPTETTATESLLEVPSPPTNPLGPDIPAPPTDPSGPGTSRRGRGGPGPDAASRRRRAGNRRPAREAAERVTFATWAIVTGKSPGGIFNELPKVDDATAAKIAERLSERAGHDHRRRCEGRDDHREVGNRGAGAS